jgi:hypothetical protein
MKAFQLFPLSTKEVERIHFLTNNKHYYINTTKGHRKRTP